MAHADHIPKLAAPLKKSDFDLYFKEVINFGVRYYPDCERSTALLKYLKKKALNKHEMTFFKDLGMKLFITGHYNLGSTARKTKNPDFIAWVTNSDIEI